MINVLVAVVLVIAVWRRQPAPGSRSVLAFLFGLIIWSLGYVFELSAETQAQALFWARFEYLGITTVPASMFGFALSYTGRFRWLSQRHLIGLAVEPILIMALVWTNDLHGWIWPSVESHLMDGMLILDVSHGVAFWVHVAYSYLLLLGATMLILQALVRSPDLYRGQVIPLLVGALAPWAGNIVFVSNIVPIDPTPIAFMFTAVALSISLFQFQLLNVVPVAHDRVLESMEDAVLVLDAQDHVVDANPAAAKLLRTSVNALMGKQPNEAFAAYPRLLECYGYCGETGTEVNLGEEHPSWYDMRLTMIRAANGCLLGRLMVLRNIDLRKQAEEMMAEALDQALQASLLKTQLIANVSHEMRTPLNAILGYAEMLRSGVWGQLNEEQADTLQRMLYSAQQLNIFINDLLDQSLIEKGRLVLNLDHFPTRSLLDGARAMLENQAHSKGLEFYSSIDSNLPPVLHGDQKRLQQILVNLLTNAIKFTDEGWVRFELRRLDNEHWLIEVRDTGIGIAPEQQKLIFEPFRQLDASTTRRHGGAGLGLAIVQHLTTMMGGYIEMESDYGKGSTFRVILPFKQQGSRQ
jgi:PAS domain S-box-containing protein